MGLVNFYVGTYANYSALETKDSDSLYFITDTLQLFKGLDEYTKSAKLVYGLPTTDQVQGVLYVNLRDFTLNIWNGSEYVQITKDYATSIEDPGDNDTVPTTKAVVDYVTNKVADVVGGTGVFVTDVTYEDGNLYISKGSEPTSQTLTGIVNNPTYDHDTRTITLPVFGNDALVIELGKDCFVESGYYDAEKETIELTLTSGDTVSIPVGSLIDIYTGLATATATTTVTSDNTISVSVKVSATADNKITIEDDGLYVSLADYYTKTEVDAATQVISDKLDDHINNTTIHVTAEDKEMWDAKVSEEELATAKSEVLAAAEADATAKAAAALESAQEYTDTQIAGYDTRITNVENALEWKEIED